MGLSARTRSQCCPLQLCLCAALCNDLLLSCVHLQGVSSQHHHACARRLSSFLATCRVQVREHCQLFNRLPIFKHLRPLSLTFQIPDKPLQLGKALLSGTRHLLAQLVHDECYVCSVLTEEQTSGNLWSVLVMLNLTPWLRLFLFCHIGVYTELPCSSPRTTTSTSTCLGSC